MEVFLDRSSQSKDAVQLRSQITEKSQAEGDLQLPLQAGQRRESGAGAGASRPAQGDLGPGTVGLGHGLTVLPSSPSHSLPITPSYGGSSGISMVR